MKVTRQHTFDAPVEDVWAMFRDKDSHVAKFEGMGHENVEVLEHETSDEHVRIVIARDVTIDLPGFARKVLTPTNHVISTDRWQAHGARTYGGTFDLVARGAPVRIAGTTHIAPDGDDRTRYQLEIDVSVNVPVVGRKITSWAKGDVEKQMQQEFDAGDAWLATHA